MTRDLAHPAGPILLCAPSSSFLDDVQGYCSQCGETIYWRPHAPSQIPRWCMSCFAVVARAGDQWAITAETVRELLALAMPTRGVQ
jgi:hypothetical protein